MSSPAAQPSGTAPNPVVRLAYDEARVGLNEQDDTLANVRNRATGLLAAATVGTSFSATAGLLNNDPTHGKVFPVWGAWLLLAVLLAIAAGVMIVLWPTNDWVFGPDPGKLLDSANLELDDVLTRATQAMIVYRRRNAEILNRRFTAYRLAASALVIEVGLLVVVLLIARR